MQTWTEQVRAVCPSVSEQWIVQDLAVTKNPSTTINRILDGAVAPICQESLVVQVDAAPSIDLLASSHSSSSPANGGGEELAVIKDTSVRTNRAVGGAITRICEEDLETTVTTVDLSSPPRKSSADGVVQELTLDGAVSPIRQEDLRGTAGNVDLLSPPRNSSSLTAGSVQEFNVTEAPTVTRDATFGGADTPICQKDLVAAATTVDLSLPSHSSSSPADEKQDQCGVDRRPGWGSLRPPTSRDMAIRRGSRSIIQPAPLEFLVVLDFEWTADNRRAMLPISEITQFPSVLVRLAGRGSVVVDEFNSYVRPTCNPTLTSFSIELTGITQATVDESPTLEAVLPQYLQWLLSHGLTSDTAGSKVGRWAFCTWSDADIGSQLVRELGFKQLAIPLCFNQWIDLKTLYKRHYKVEPRGGLQTCVERLGLSFEGRAHDGLVDCRNTAKIALHMACGSMLHGAFVFRRFTRGLDEDGNPFGSKANLEKRRKRMADEQ